MLHCIVVQRATTHKRRSRCTPCTYSVAVACHEWRCRSSARDEMGGLLHRTIPTHKTFNKNTAATHSHIKNTHSQFHILSIFFSLSLSLPFISHSHTHKLCSNFLLSACPITTFASAATASSDTWFATPSGRPAAARRSDAGASRCSIARIAPLSETVRRLLPVASCRTPGI